MSSLSNKLTMEEAVAKLKKLGWCCSPQHPYSGAFNYYLCGNRLPTEAYGPFPDGFVDRVYGRGDTFIEAVEDALKKKEVSHV